MVCGCRMISNLMTTGRKLQPIEKSLGRLLQAKVIRGRCGYRAIVCYPLPFSLHYDIRNLSVILGKCQEFKKELFGEGADIMTVKELMGHKDLSMTLRYAHLAPDHKTRTIHLLDRIMSLNPPQTKKASEVVSLRPGNNWLGDQDSNLDSWSQSPLSYH